TIPYFLDIEDCPKNTLFAWPKDLLIEAKNLPGMPNEWQVKWALKRGRLSDLKPKKQFDSEQYQQLRTRFLDYFHQHLTTQALSDYLKRQLRLPPEPKILLCFGVWVSAIDYCRDILINALGADDKIKLSLYPFPYWHLI